MMENRTWADQVDFAMHRGGSPYTVLDLLRWLREGSARMWIWPSMHASAVILDGKVEIGHVFGRWTNEEAREITSRISEFSREHGFDDVTVNGRPGWQRFLEMRRFWQ